MGSNFILAAHGISKSFSGVLALKEVDFELYPGEIHALVGENGAGKSTLIKTISGVYKADAGSMVIEGEQYCSITTNKALNLGIRVIYQELSLFEHLSGAENIFAGQLPTRKKTGLVDRKKLN